MECKQQPHIQIPQETQLCLDKALGEKKGRKESRKRGSTLAPTPSDSCRSTSTCLSSEQAVEEASLWWRVRPVHVQVWAQRPVCLVDIDFFEALHLNHLKRTRYWIIYPDHFQLLRRLLLPVAQHSVEFYDITLSTVGHLRKMNTSTHIQ